MHYLLVFNPELPPPFREDTRSDQAGLQYDPPNEEHSGGTEGSPDSWAPNVVDVQLLSFIRKAAKKILQYGPGLPTGLSTHRSAHFQRCFDRVRPHYLGYVQQKLSSRHRPLPICAIFKS